MTANLLSATVPGVGGRVFNVGTGKHITINELWEAVQRLAGLSMPVQYGPPRAGDIRESVADISLGTSLLGFAPACGFDAGLETTFTWFKGSGEAK